MNVKELKKRLEEFDDNLEIHIYTAYDKLTFRNYPLNETMIISKANSIEKEYMLFYPKVDREKEIN